MKRYDFERYSWQPVLSSHEGCRLGSCVVAAGNNLYVCGGFLEGDFVTKAGRFDTVGNKWEEIASMQQKRGNAFVVASKGKIFVAGGTNWQGCFKTCEICFDKRMAVYWKFECFSHVWQYGVSERNTLCAGWHKWLWAKSIEC